MEAQAEHVHFACNVLARLGADSHAHSALSNKNLCVGAQEEVC